MHRGDPDPARPVPAQSHLESPQVLGHRAACREGSQLCRQVLRSLGSVLFEYLSCFGTGAVLMIRDPMLF